MVRNTRTYWGSLSRAFHWTLALLIVGMLSYGWWMNHMAARPDRFFHRSIHADIGYVVLLLMVLRLIWRWMNPVPALPADAPRWERLSARVSHFALYAVTMVVALLGWAHSGAHKPDYSDWFGLFRVPQFTSPDKANADLYEDWHIWSAYLLIALVTIHILAALFHMLVRDDNVVARMTVGEDLDRPSSTV
jgi:cytochrome b561